MTTYNNKEHLIVYKYLRKLLDKIIKKTNKKNREINQIRQEVIIEILDHLEGKWKYLNLNLYMVIMINEMLME